MLVRFMKAGARVVDTATYVLSDDLVTNAQLTTVEVIRLHIALTHSLVIPNKKMRSV